MGSQPASRSLDALRARIRELEGSSVTTRRVATGVEALDGLVGGIPCPGILEVVGAPGEGRTRLAAAVSARWTAEGQAVAWVDPQRRLFPPGLALLGVELDRLILLRPTVDRELWAVEQVARSGCFPVVVVLDATVGKRAGHRWGRAAEAGQCTLVVLGERPERGLSATVRLSTGEGELVVQRDRGAFPGRRAPLPPWPADADPWEPATT